MKRLNLLGAILALVFSSGDISGQGFLKAKGITIVDDKGRNVLLRGVGLGGWMLQEGYMLKVNNEGQQYRIRQRIEELVSKEQAQEFYDTWLENHTRKIDIDSMKSWGFNSVRLPMHYNLYTLPVDQEPVAGQQTWLEKGFTITDSLLSWCKANEMYLILDLHAAPGGQGNDLNISDRDPSKPSLWESEANQQKTVALWKKLAERYANEPWIGAYDIINEPNWGFADTVNDKNGLKEKGNAPLRKLMMEITKAIREVDKNHIIIIEGNGWGNNYNGVLPVWDNNMVLSFHKYWNYNDQNSIRQILAMRKEHNVPVWLGETGENSNTWFTEAIRLLEKNNIGWAWWPLKKVGINNPLEIRSNHNYNNLVDYWNGKRKNAPKESDVYSGLLELATYAKLESNVVHRDVIDAMIRQPFNHTAKPYKPNKLKYGYIMQAAEFDLGANGIAYYDMDTANYRISSGKNSAGNKGNVFRNDGVDIYKDSSRFERYYVGSTEKGEWLQYTVTVPETMKFQLALDYSADSTGVITIMDGKKILAREIRLAPTKSAKDWQINKQTTLTLTKGIHPLRILVSSGGFQLREIHFLQP